MAVTKAKKAEQIEKLNSQLQNASSMIVGSFSKLTVAKDYELRKTVRSVGGSYKVVKNTLAKRASEGTRVAEALKGLKGKRLTDRHSSSDLGHEGVSGGAR